MAVRRSTAAAGEAEQSADDVGVATAFEASVDAAIARCTTLSSEDAREFLKKGYVIVKNAFDKKLAADIVAAAWRELEDQGIMQDDPKTWKQSPYTRTGGPPNVGIMASRGDKQAQAEMAAVRERYGLPKEPRSLLQAAPRALGAQLDAVGGWDRVDDPGSIKLPDSVAVNLCSEQVLGEEGWRSANAPGWHKVRRSVSCPEYSLFTNWAALDRMVGTIATSSIRHNKACCWRSFSTTLCLNPAARRSALTPWVQWPAFSHSNQREFILEV